MLKLRYLLIAILFISPIYRVNAQADTATLNKLDTLKNLVAEIDQLKASTNIYFIAADSSIERFKLCKTDSCFVREITAQAAYLKLINIKIARIEAINAKLEELDKYFRTHRIITIKASAL